MSEPASPVGPALVQGRVGHHLLKMSSSMLIGFVAGAAFNITDTYFVSRLGTEPLAAMGYTFPFVALIHGLVMGIGMGTASVLSRTIGGGDQAGARRITMHSLALGLVLTLAFIAAGYVFLDPALRAMGATDELLPLVRDYMHVWLAGMLFLVIPMIGNNAIRATGDTLSPSLIMAADLTLNVVLDPIFIFGFGPIPAMGIEGAAVATVLARSLALVASLYVLGRRKGLISFRRSADGAAEGGLLRSWAQIGYVGLPAAGTNMLTPVALGIIMNIISDFGPARVAAVTAGSRIEHVVVIPLMALGASLVPFIGQNWGAGDRARARRANLVASRAALAWGAVCLLALASLAGLVAPLFSDDPAVVPWLELFLAIMPVAFGFRGVLMASTQAMNAINRPFDAAGTTTLRLFGLQWPLAALGAQLLGFPGVLLGIIAADVIAALVATARTRYLLRDPAPSSTAPEPAAAAQVPAVQPS